MSLLEGRGENFSAQSHFALLREQVDRDAHGALEIPFLNRGRLLRQRHPAHSALGLQHPHGSILELRIEGLVRSSVAKGFVAHSAHGCADEAASGNAGQVSAGAGWILLRHVERSRAVHEAPEAIAERYGRLRQIIIECQTK